MQYFHTMVSNTVGGSAPQTFFRTSDPQKAYVGRVFYKAFAGGEYDYSFLFSGGTDSSFPIENVTSRNTPVLGWEICSARVGVCAKCTPSEMPYIDGFQTLTFDGKGNKQVTEEGLFYSDEISLSVKKGEYICLEITYRGEKIPHHYENSIPSFLQEGEGWIPSNRAVFASMVGCNRPVEKKIAFLGDSITQGLGTACNGYGHWNALLAEGLGERYAFWNLGIGFGMANDGATDGAWLYKAKQNDLVIVCFGVNDIFRVRSAAQTKQDLRTIVEKLKKAGCQVIVQTVPPFDYQEEPRAIWKELNGYIETELASLADLVLDIVPLLGDGEGKSKYNPHPDEEGCRVWAEGILPRVREFLEKEKEVCKE